MRGFWWSPDSKRIVFVEVDETHIPAWRITHHGAEQRTHEEHAYPFAGEANYTQHLPDGLGRVPPWELVEHLGWHAYLAEPLPATYAHG